VNLIGAAGLISMAPITGRSLEADLPRVRPNYSPLIAELLVEGAKRSASFRQLVQKIDASDGIVYVEEGRCGHQVRACLALTVRIAGPNRIMRIIVEPRRYHDELIAAIAHELQHAVEALSNPAVRDAFTMYWFFDRIGRTDTGAFETEEAIQMGLNVLHELETKAK
jgi:hypothetical protein